MSNANNVGDIFIKTVDTENLKLQVTQVDKNIDNIFLKKLKEKLENKCNKNGLVKKDSVKIINYSCGILDGCDILYTITYECEICNPVEGMVIECYVKNITKAGVRGELLDYKNEDVSPIVVFIARDHEYSNVKFQELKENDVINVKIIGSRYVLNDEFICCIGSLNVEN